MPFFQSIKRQWALIHSEQQWEENVKMVEGQHLHRKADHPFTREKRGNKLIVRAMPIKSNQLKITGICDVVEFLKDDNDVEIFGAEGKYLPYPVEYKRGKPKKDESDLLQLAAQALCLGLKLTFSFTINNRAPAGLSVRFPLIYHIMVLLVGYSIMVIKKIIIIDIYSARVPTLEKG